MTDRWWEKAACSGEDPERFFPPNKKGVKSKKFLEDDLPDVIYEFCNKCPVEKDCLKDAMKMQSLNRISTIFGIWGGTTEYMRREILKRSPDEA